VAKRALKSTLYMRREPIGSNATYGSGAFPTREYGVNRVRLRAVVSNL
jgi:hypothetical protein